MNASNKSESRLDVTLDEVRVGHIDRNRHGALRFVPDSAWLESRQRPPLGLAFLQNPRPRPSPPELPAWFENVLPERGGALRRWLCSRHGLRDDDSGGLLALLGSDLPGAVLVRGTLATEPQGRTSLPPPPEDRYRFSLAGLQLKLSMTLAGDRYTLPVRGSTGRWIVKFPDPERVELPEIEHATMAWARAVGIEVPEFRCIDVEQLEGLPPSLLEGRPRAFAVRRFDRADDGRVHQEDFAQALGLRPDEKYADRGVSTSFDMLTKLVGDACGDAARELFLRRLAFMVASGNDDAHLKNWSFQWGRSHQPRLSPAYDLVATLSYRLEASWQGNDGPTLALSLGRERRFARLERTHVETLCARVQVPNGTEVFMETLARAAEAWSEIEPLAPTRMREAIGRLWRTVPVLRELRLSASP